MHQLMFKEVELFVLVLFTCAWMKVVSWELFLT